MAKAPKFRALLESGHSAKELAIMLGLATEDSGRYEMLFDLGCIPTVLSALASEAGRLTAKLPEHQRPPQQVLQARSMQAALNNGAVTLTLVLESGAEIVFQFPKENTTIDLATAQDFLADGKQTTH